MPGSGGSITFAPEADALVYALDTTNRGDAVILRADTNDDSYLRFNVNNVGGSITQATLRLYVIDSNNDGFSVNSVADNSWDEMTMRRPLAPSSPRMEPRRPTLGWKSTWATTPVDR
jgi:hypothetical protein